MSENFTFHTNLLQQFPDQFEGLGIDVSGEGRRLPKRVKLINLYTRVCFYSLLDIEIPIQWILPQNPLQNDKVTGMEDKIPRLWGEDVSTT